MKNWKVYLFVIFASLLPVMSLFWTDGMPVTSDGLAHAIRFAVYFKELISGQLPVRWVGQFHYGYGTAMFDFVAPLAYMVTLPLVAAGFSLTLILKISFAFTYVLAGITMCMFSLRYFRSKRAAFLVTIMYQFAPFRLVEMNSRGNLGTLYAYAFVPLLFYFIIRQQEKKDYPSFVFLAVSTALLCLSHTIIGYAFIGFGLLFVLFRQRKIVMMLPSLFSLITGVGLAAFFVIPGILEQKYTNGYLFTKNLFYDHFPELYKLLLPNFFNSPSLRIYEVAVQIGLFHIIALLALVYLFVKNSLKGEMRKLGIFIFVATVVTIVFMQPIAKSVWENIPIIRQLQYPWRFLAIITFTTALASNFYLSLKPLQDRRIYSFLIVLIVMSTVYYWKPFQGYVKPDERSYWNYPLTTNYNSEFNTVWMGSEPKAYPRNRVEVIGGKAQITSVRLSSIRHSYTIDVSETATVLDRTYFFPGWKVLVDRRYREIQFQDPHYQGMITYLLEPGIHHVSVQFEQSRVQQLGNLISICTVLGLLLYIPLAKILSKQGSKAEAGQEPYTAQTQAKAMP